MTPPRRHEMLSGLYVILDPELSHDRSLSEILTKAAAGGARLVQYRNKRAPMTHAYTEASALRRVAREIGVTFLVNDRCDLALAVDADGVHLGQTDLPFGYARKIMGPDKIIGLSTHTMEQVREADHQQPQYIAFGPIFTPASKRDHDQVVGLEGLKEMRRHTALPVFAIGGIHLDHVDAVMHAGADGIAVISAVLTAADVTRAVRELVSRIDQVTRRAC